MVREEGMMERKRRKREKESMKNDCLKEREGERKEEECRKMRNQKRQDYTHRMRTEGRELAFEKRSNLRCHFQIEGG